MAQKKSPKVLIALSGGVDSSVSAHFLIEQGYDVTGVYVVNYDEQIDQKSCWVPDYHDAVRVAAHLGISLLKWDCTKEYKEKVLDYLFKEYEAGRTPNPDVLCNSLIKFGVWLNKARDAGFDYLATGHYAKLEENNGEYILYTAKDDNKDQTYFLHQLNQKQLAHILFPLGETTKDKVRKIAKKLDLPVADKEESMGICFVGEVPIKEFLQEKIAKNPGNVVDTKGNTIGKHDGLPFYTIGQRHGFEQAGGGEPLYVIAKRIESNELVVGEKHDPLAEQKEVFLPKVHWISGQSPKFPLKCKVRFRHRQELASCKIEAGKGGGVSIILLKKQRAITPGQFAVFYKKGVCLGGGEIS